VSHFLHGGGSDHDRHWDLEAQNTCGHVNLGDIDQYARTEPDHTRLLYGQTISEIISIFQNTTDYWTFILHAWCRGMKRVTHCISHYNPLSAASDHRNRINLHTSTIQLLISFQNS
jgi:hypothetical protein